MLLMIFFLFQCAFNCTQYLLFIYLTITALLTSSYGIIIHHDHYNYTKMPVITHSQAKALTGSTIQLLIQHKSSTGSSFGLSGDKTKTPLTTSHYTPLITIPILLSNNNLASSFDTSILSASSSAPFFETFSKDNDN
jgi:hypothetical protein